MVVLSFLYLSPGGDLLLENRKDLVLSDGTDPATLPYAYSLILHERDTNPSHLLYGAVPATTLNAPDGFSIWVPWIEKAVVAIFGDLVPIEQLSTLFVFIIVALTGLAFYFMGRNFGWNEAIALALAICFAINAYTRARIKVHMALAGPFHLPLIFWALKLAIARTDKRSWLLAGFLLLVAMSVAHYYLVITAFLAPLILFWCWCQREFQMQTSKAIQRIALASLPALLFLGWSYLRPLPSELAKSETITYVKTGETSDGSLHPFLRQFASRPVDFFTGDIAMPKVHDLNPLRGALNDYVLENLGDGNSHERANGIRWLIWAAFLWILIRWRKKNLMIDKESTKEVWAWLALMIFCFFLSLAPDFIGIPIGPSLWLSKLVSQFRVPSRAGIFFQFFLLCVVGMGLQAQLFEARKKEVVPRWQKWLKRGWVLPLLAILELPPFLNDMPVAKVVPARADLADGQPCGLGLYFPYVSGTWGLLEYYYFLQSMRGSRCGIVNAATDTANDRNKRFMQTMPLHPKFLEALKNQPQPILARVEHLARCVPLDWMIFDSHLPAHIMDQICHDLGWKKTSQDTCRSPERSRPMLQMPESCWP